MLRPRLVSNQQRGLRFYCAHIRMKKVRKTHRNEEREIFNITVRKMRPWLKYGFIIACLTATSMLLADDSSIVDVKMSETALSIYAKSLGYGETLEAAKIDAINKILPQLIEKTQNVPGTIENYMNDNGKEQKQGMNTIAGKTHIQNYWKLEDSKYLYKIEILLDTTK